MKRADLIHAIECPYDNVEVLNEEADVFAFPCVPERVVAFMGMRGFFRQGKALFQDLY